MLSNRKIKSKIETIDKVLLKIELIIIVFPTTLLLVVVGLPISISLTIREMSWGHLSILSITFLSIMATFSVWRMAILSLKSLGVFNQNFAFYWCFVLVGSVISVSPILWTLLGPPFPYTEVWYFYDMLSYFSFGILLMIPTLHIFISGIFKK